MRPAVDQIRQCRRAQRPGCKIRHAPLEIGNAARPAARITGASLGDRAREARGDQDQPIEIPRFRVRRTEDNRKNRADRQLFRTSAGLRDERGQHVGSLYVPLKGRSMGHAPREQGTRKPSDRRCGWIPALRWSPGQRRGCAETGRSSRSE